MKRLSCAVFACCLVLVLVACGQAELPPEEITTTTQGTTTQTTTITLEPIRHTFVQHIHESLPEFTFTVHGNFLEERDWDNFRYSNFHTIEITGEDFFQRIDGLETIMPHIEFAFADFNNDGFLDIALRIYPDRSAPSMFWLWNNEKQQFVENDQLNEMSRGLGYNVTLAEDGRIYAFAISGRDWGGSYYSYINGEFIEEKRVYRDRGTIFTYELINGEMVLVHTEEEVLE